ncbi:HTH domain-containing protein [Natrinema salinisoli]|uniref:HTH domain-containing protein n=1 Tax=Natrinema salinisoli TaxID=2878535 RepID=UPI001CF09070|nr:HTH domain-containing protein [Natrinema salinisoli]
MSAREPGVSLLVDSDSRGHVHIDCYVRSAIPTGVSEQITTLVERLRTLRECGCVDEVDVSRWPSKRSIAAETEPTCDELVAEFERWADRHGYSLEPGFRRRTIPPSPLGVDAEARERVRVPLVALALYEEDADAEILRGVVPCTELSYTDDEHTYTVDEWLATVETRALDEPVRSSQIDRKPLLEGQ